MGYISIQKIDCFKIFLKFSRMDENEKDIHIKEIRINHDGKFKIHFWSLWKSISYELSSPRTAQQNGDIEKEQNVTRDGYNDI